MLPVGDQNVVHLKINIVSRPLRSGGGVTMSFEAVLVW